MVDFSKEKDYNRVDGNVDSLLSERPEERKRIQDNRSFAEDFKKEPIADSHATVKAFGKSVNLNAVLKKDIDKRSVFTVDNLCDMFLSWRIDQLQKYQKKKRGMDFNWIWLLLLMAIGIGGVVLVIAFLLPSLGGIGTGGLMP